MRTKAECKGRAALKLAAPVCPSVMQPGDRVLVDWELGEVLGTVTAVDTSKGKVTVLLDPPISQEVTVPEDAVRPAEPPDQARQRPVLDKAVDQQPSQGAGGQELSEGRHAFDSE